MSGFPIVDLVAGMIFIYFLLSVICSSVVEMILTVNKVRPQILEKWLYRIFDKPVTLPDGTSLSLGQAIMDHCSVTALSKPGTAPSYIDAKNFTSALLEKITFDPNNPDSIATDLDSFIASVKNANSLSTEFQRVLLTYAYEARDTYEAVSEKTISELALFRSKVESWYDSSMDRLTGVLKRSYSRPFTIVVAIVTALLLNADSISISKYLYSNPDARAKVAAQAYNVAKDSLIKFNNRIAGIQSLKDSATVEELKATYRKGLDNISEAKAALEADIPLGWNNKVFINENGNVSAWLVLSKLCGLTATVLAMVMGAPFWFDLLNKISNVRGAGPKPVSTTNDDNDSKK